MVRQIVRVSVLGLALLVVVVSGCSQPLNKREKGALVGGGFGAATGAIIGAAVGNPGAGAAIGGAMGALGGGIIGDQLQGVENRQNYQQAEINTQQREIQRQRQELQRLKQKTTTRTRKTYEEDEEY